jgi:nitrate reductase NapAB chaperone NapD
MKESTLIEMKKRIENLEKVLTFALVRLDQLEQGKQEEEKK